MVEKFHVIGKQGDLTLFKPCFFELTLVVRDDKVISKPDDGLISEQKLALQVGDFVYKVERQNWKNLKLWRYQIIKLAEESDCWLASRESLDCQNQYCELLYETWQKLQQDLKVLKSTSLSSLHLFNFFGWELETVAFPVNYSVDKNIVLLKSDLSVSSIQQECDLCIKANIASGVCLKEGMVICILQNEPRFLLVDEIYPCGKDAKLLELPLFKGVIRAKVLNAFMQQSLYFSQQTLAIKYA